MISLTNLQKQAISAAPHDANENVVSNNGAANPVEDSGGLVCQIANISTNGLNFDVVGVAPGIATVKVIGTKPNGDQYFSTFGVTVTMDPSIPGPPTHFVFIFGAVLPK